MMGTPDGALLALDAASGDRRWQYRVTDQGSTQAPGHRQWNRLLRELSWRPRRLGSPPLERNGGAVTPVGEVAQRSLRMASSSSTEFQTMDNLPCSTHSMPTPESCSGVLDEGFGNPSVSNGIGYAGHPSGEVLAFDVDTGDELWRVQVGPPLRPFAVASGLVYVASSGDLAVHAFDAESGAERLELPDRQPQSTVAVAVADGVALHHREPTLGSIYAIGGVRPARAGRCIPRLLLRPAGISEHGGKVRQRSPARRAKLAARLNSFGRPAGGVHCHSIKWGGHPTVSPGRQRVDRRTASAVTSRSSRRMAHSSSNGVRPARRTANSISSATTEMRLGRVAFAPDGTHFYVARHRQPAHPAFRRRPHLPSTPGAALAKMMASSSIRSTSRSIAGGRLSY